MPEKIEETLDISLGLREPDKDEMIAAGLLEVAVTQPLELVDDDICLAIKEDELPDTLFKAVIYGLAEEQNSLKTLRQKKSNEGKDSSGVSVKRGTLLKYLTDALMQRQHLMGSSSELDLRGPRFREVFRMFLGIISETFDEVKIPSEFKEMFFHALSSNLEGWEDRAEKKLKKMK